jgi:hypothetical protein
LCSATSHQQLASELAFQPLDLLCERGLCDAGPLGCTPEVLLFSQNDEVMELAQCGEVHMSFILKLAFHDIGHITSVTRSLTL